MELEKTKKLYIEMCSKTPEFQKLWKPAIGDYYYRKSIDKVYLLTTNKVINRKDCVWLPTDKQLYEKICRMYGILDWRTFDQMVAEEYDYFLRILGEHPSKEICGLAAMMYNAFFKRWKDGEWG